LQQNTRAAGPSLAGKNLKFVVGAVSISHFIHRGLHFLKIRRLWFNLWPSVKLENDETLTFYNV
jgi:hypothetical protein